MIQELKKVKDRVVLSVQWDRISFAQYEKLMQTLALPENDLVANVYCPQTPVFSVLKTSQGCQVTPNPSVRLDKGMLWCEKENICQQAPECYNGDRLAEFFWKDMDLESLTSHLRLHRFFIQGDKAIASY